MNPSAVGWIDKLGSVISKKTVSYTSHSILYQKLKKVGFIYGINVSLIEPIPVDYMLSKDEIAKINIFCALYTTYVLEKDSNDFNAFLEALLLFYQEIEIHKISFFDRIIPGSSTSAQLEKLIHGRVLLHDNFVTKNFNNIITNALLYIDILAFKKYLSGASQIKEYAAAIENFAATVTFETLEAKTDKSIKDEQLEKLFNSSLSYTTIDSITNTSLTSNQEIDKKFSAEERLYFLDIACLVTWEDHNVSSEEAIFVLEIGEKLGFKPIITTKSLTELEDFFELHKDNIDLFTSRSTVNQFYDNLSQVVKKLIRRNSKRLQKELLESKELLALIMKASNTDLSEEEKKKIKNQLLDIFKAIPSLAIFVLPGGAVLLPIFIKLIPKLLPSAFNDNKIDPE